MPAVTKAGIEWATWHDFRHTFASRLAMTGYNEGTIAALLRHSTTVLVKRYAHLSPSHLKAAVEGVVGFGKDAGENIERKAPEVQTEAVSSERSGKPESAEVGVVEGERFGAPDTN